jgi:hypothetical protein
MKRVAALISLVVVASLGFATPVLAAPAPANDVYSGRAAIPSLPFTDSLDTTKATTDATDDEMNPPDCGAPATDASVWYELTPAAHATVVVDVSASTYSAGVSVATGSPGSFTFVTCGPGVVLFTALGGETYTILVFDDQLDGSGNGGTLNISVEEAPPAPTVSLTVDPIGHFNSATGSATVTGSVTCTGVADFTFLDVQLSQTVGRISTVSGFGETEFVCDGTTQLWSVEVFPSNGLFKGGQASSVTVAVACGFFECGFDEVTRTIRLRA